MCRHVQSRAAAAAAAAPPADGAAADVLLQRLRVGAAAAAVRAREGVDGGRGLRVLRGGQPPDDHRGPALLQGPHPANAEVSGGGGGGGRAVTLRDELRGHDGAAVADGPTPRGPAGGERRRRRRQVEGDARAEEAGAQEARRRRRRRRIYPRPRSHGNV